MNSIVVGIAALGTAASAGYCVLCAWAGIRFSRRRDTAVDSGAHPGVSILKAVKGADPEMYESLRSHCVQNYPAYEMLLGVSDSNDPAIAVIEKLTREFPSEAIRVVQCEQRLGANGKVSSLIQLAAAAKYEYLLVNDSDIRVEPGYLRTVISELQQPEVGLVTCLYRGVPADTVPSKLESLGISTDFMAGVLAARLIEGGMRFGLGSTLAFRRRELVAIGGFEALADYLADDYELGRRISDNGLKIQLSQSVVETFIPAYDFRGFFSHQLRWARTIRASRLSGYAGLLLTFTLPWAALCVALAGGSAWSWALLAVACTTRGAMALITGRTVLGDRAVLRSLWLLPVRDFLAVLIWVSGWAGRGIVWRGERFTLRKGKLTRR